MHIYINFVSKQLYYSVIIEINHISTLEKVLTNVKFDIQTMRLDFPFLRYICLSKNVGKRKEQEKPQ